MPTHVDARREAAHAFFEFLERALAADETLADKQCVRLIIEKAQTEHAAQSRKRFDAEDAFRRKLLYTKIDDALATWCRKREVRTDPYNVFRYGGAERGPRNTRRPSARPCHLSIAPSSDSPRPSRK